MYESERTNASGVLLFSGSSGPGANVTVLVKETELFGDR
jgi:hypothetical protein